MSIFQYVFPKKRTWSIAGRTIILTDRCTGFDKEKEFYTRIILQECQEDDMAKAFLRLNFEFVSYPWANFLAAAYLPVKILFIPVSRKHMKIMINLDGVRENNEKAMDVEYAKSVIRHEITHLYHFYFHESTLKGERINRRLKKQAKVLPSDYRSVRSELNRVIQSIYREGLATKNMDKGKMTREQFEEGYREATIAAENAEKTDLMHVDQVWNLRSMKKERKGVLLFEMQECTYIIGKHMVQAILFFTNLTLDDMMKQDYTGFFRKYEETMIKANMRPVITWSSGRGIIDYKKLIEHFTEKFMKEYQRVGE